MARNPDVKVAYTNIGFEGRLVASKGHTCSKGHHTCFERQLPGSESNYFSTYIGPEPAEGKW